MCPDTSSIDLQGSKTMLEKLKNRMADVSDITAKEFRLVINTCWDIHGDDAERNCIHMNDD